MSAERRIIYFDNGATTWPKPRQVMTAVNEAFQKYGANPGRSGHIMSMNTAMKVFETREAAAELFGAAQPEDVVFTSNCTQAVNMAIKGVLHQGDHVILSDLEHNATLRPVHTLAKRGEIAYSIAEIHPDDDMTVETFRRLITPTTRLIICTHGSNVWGIRTPIERIGALAREHGIYFLVDAAQTAGVVPIDMRKCNIDFLCMAGHKGLYGPSGTGLLITPHGEEMATILEGGTGTLSAEYEQPQGMPERLESGTVNTMGIMGLGAGIRFVKTQGLERIRQKEMQIAVEIYRRLAAMEKVRVYNGTFTAENNLPVVSFNIEGKSSEDTALALSDRGFALRGGLHCAPLAHQKMGTMTTGAARISVGAFNSMEEARALCNAIQQIAR